MIVYHQILPTCVRRNMWDSIRSFYSSILAVNGLNMKSILLHDWSKRKFSCWNQRRKKVSSVFLIDFFNFLKAVNFLSRGTISTSKVQQKAQVLYSLGILESSLRMEMLTNTVSRVFCLTNVNQQSVEVQHWHPTNVAINVTVGTLSLRLKIWPSWADLCELFSGQVYSRDSKLCSRISPKVQAIGKSGGAQLL